MFPFCLDDIVLNMVPNDMATIPIDDERIIGVPAYLRRFTTYEGRETGLCRVSGVPGTYFKFEIIKGKVVWSIPVCVYDDYGTKTTFIVRTTSETVVSKVVATVTNTDGQFVVLCIGDEKAADYLSPDARTINFAVSLELLNHHACISV